YSDCAASYASCADSRARAVVTSVVFFFFAAAFDAPQAGAPGPSNRPAIASSTRAGEVRVLRIIRIPPHGQRPPSEAATCLAEIKASAWRSAWPPPRGPVLQLPARRFRRKRSRRGELHDPCRRSPVPCRSVHSSNARARSWRERFGQILNRRAGVEAG